MPVGLYNTSAHAKVNLRLKVMGQREDGYHLLSMLNVLIELADQIQVQIDASPTKEVVIAVAGGTGANWEQNPAKNLAARAARVFLDEYAINARVEIALTKRIPVGAGLGGGSSDAAAVLRLLAASFIEQRSARTYARRLDQLALSLGADVPYFLDQRPAIVTGIGEIITALELDWIDRLAFLLVVPPFGLSTSEVFETYRALRDSSDCVVKVDREANELLKKPLEFSKLLKYLENDLESAACMCQPELARLLLMARRIDRMATVMSGSGAAFLLLPRSLSDDYSSDFSLARERFEQQGCRVIQSRFVAAL